MHCKLADAVFMILGLGVVGEKGDSVLVSEAYFLHSLHWKLDVLSRVR